jgi:hypothetical protein
MERLLLFLPFFLTSSLPASGTDLKSQKDLFSGPLLACPFHCRRSRLVENRRFRQAGGKGAGKYKGKIQAMLYCTRSIYLSLLGPSFPRFLEPGSLLLLLERSEARPFSNTQRTVEFFWHCILLVASDDA